MGHTASSLRGLPPQLRGRIPRELQSGGSHILYQTRRRVDLGIGDAVGTCSMPTLVLNSGDDCDMNRHAA